GFLGALGGSSRPDEADEGLTTIAFLPFDNFSVEKHQSRLGRLSSALAEFFAYDFSSYSGLKIVERDKLDFLLKEQELVSAGRIDKATAIKVGKIVGAKMMVFGLISQFDDKNARMGVKVVNVETSEIITTVDKEGKPDFNKMQKELVQELAKKLDIKLNEKSKKSLKLGGTDSMEAMDFYARGLEFMDDYDYEQAYQNFKNAYEMDGEFIQAKEKMETYWPLVG
ncbi:MAG: CsgG/HfaB family protein, partial [Candidatus Zixiibacteriota bacterium]